MSRKSHLRRGAIPLALLLLAGCQMAPVEVSLPASETERIQESEYEVAAIRSVGKHKGDYLPAHNFKLEIDGVIAGGFERAPGLKQYRQRPFESPLDRISGGFKEVSGLESEIEVIEFKDGDDPVTHKRAGKAKYKNIVLKRGMVNDASLLEWYKRVLSGQVDRKSGSVIYLDRAGTEVLRLNFFNAWPVRWKAPELNSHSDTHLVEEIEFVVEKVERG